MKSSALFAPDGMRVSGGIAEQYVAAVEMRALMDVVVGHERADDGLVHHHGWAVRGYAGEPRIQGGGRKAVVGRTAMDVVLPDDHDDGLVHAHDWAVSAR